MSMDRGHCEEGKTGGIHVWIGRRGISPKKQKAANFRSLLPGLYPPPGTCQTVADYWLSGLKVRMPASVLEQTPAGSTRTTASSSAQNARRPVWLIVIGTARAVYPTLTPPATVP